MIRANMGEILKKSRDKYTLVLMSAKAARELIQRDVIASKNSTAPKDAYSLKDSSKHLSEAVKGILKGGKLRFQHLFPFFRPCCIKCWLNTAIIKCIHLFLHNAVLFDYYSCVV